MQRIVLPFFIATLFIGCSATLDPRGGGSTIYFYSRNSVDLFEMSVDGVSQGTFDMGIEVPPGTHIAKARYEIKKPCEVFTSRVCISEIYQGTCEASVVTELNHEYAVDISGMIQEPFVHVFDKQNEKPAGAGLCHYIGQDFEFEKHR